MHQQVYSCFSFVVFSLFFLPLTSHHHYAFHALLFGLEWSGWSVWQAGFTLPMGISWEKGREGEEEGEGGVYKWHYFYWPWCITWNLRNYVYENYIFNRTAVGTGEQDQLFWGLLNNGCIFAWAAQNNPPVQILCHPSRGLYCPELPVPWHRQHLHTPAAVPGFEQRSGTWHSQNAGRDKQGL